jgi:hypothetical protein
MTHIIEADTTTAIAIHVLGGIAVYYACQRALTVRLSPSSVISERYHTESFLMFSSTLSRPNHHRPDHQESRNGHPG